MPIATWHQSGRCHGSAVVKILVWWAHHMVFVSCTNIVNTGGKRSLLCFLMQPVSWQQTELADCVSGVIIIIIIQLYYR